MREGYPRDQNLGRRFASDTNEGDESSNSKTSDDTSTTETTDSSSSQHSTWVQYQQSIAVSGFETGQTVREKTLGKKSRGGALARKRKEKEAELEAMLKGDTIDVTQLKGGEFPSLRYSDEETERLLAEAYGAIPPRAGKRGTLNLKREKRRWWIKRMYDRKKKFENIATHEKVMAKRKRINEEIKEQKRVEPEKRRADKAYQNMVLERWAALNGKSMPVVAVSTEVEA